MVSDVPPEATTFSMPAWCSRYHIGITFNQQTLIEFINGLPGKISTVQDLAFYVNFVLGRIDIFGRFIAFANNTRAKTNYFARLVMHGENDTATIVVERFTVAHHYQTAFLQIFDAVLGRKRRLRKRVAGFAKQ